MKFSSAIYFIREQSTAIMQIKYFLIHLLSSYIISFSQNCVHEVYFFWIRTSTGIINILTGCPLNFIHNKLLSFLLTKAHKVDACTLSLRISAVCAFITCHISSRYIRMRQNAARIDLFTQISLRWKTHELCSI